FALLNFLFFSSRRRHTRSKRDWSSDVCSSDLFLLRTVLLCSNECSSFFISSSSLNCNSVSSFLFDSFTPFFIFEITKIPIRELVTRNAIIESKIPEIILETIAAVSIINSHLPVTLYKTLFLFYHNYFHKLNTKFIKNFIICWITLNDVDNFID